MKIQSVMIPTIVINLNLESLVGKCKIEIFNLVSEQNLQHVYLLLISAVFFIFVSEKNRQLDVQRLEYPLFLIRKHLDFGYHPFLLLEWA